MARVHAPRRRHPLPETPRRPRRCTVGAEGSGSGCWRSRLFLFRLREKPRVFRLPSATKLSLDPMTKSRIWSGLTCPHRRESHSPAHYRDGVISFPRRRSNRRPLTFLTLAALLAGMGLAVVGSPAHAADLTGEIRITKQIDGSGPVSGWAFSITNDQSDCALPTGQATTVTTDAAGLAVFGDLLMTSGSTTCTYTVTETAQDGFDQVTPASDLAGLPAGTLVPATSSSVALSAVSGYFDNPTRNDSLAIACLAGDGTDEMRAGRNPFTGACSLAFEDQSGVGFAGQTSTELPLGVTPVAQLTHFNQTIQRGFSNADLHVSFTFTDLATNATETVSADYQVTIDETSDTANPCAYPDGPNGNLPGGFGCADRFNIVQPSPANVPVVIGGTTVNLDLAFLPVTGGVCDTAGTPTSWAYTAEQTDTSFCLVAQVSAEPTVTPTEVTVINKQVVTPTETPVPSPSASPTATDTPSPSATVSPTAPVSPSDSASATPTDSASPSGSATPSDSTQPSATTTGTPTATGTDPAIDPTPTSTDIEPEGSASAQPTVVTPTPTPTTSPGGGGLPETGQRVLRSPATWLALLVLGVGIVAVRRRLS